MKIEPFYVRVTTSEQSITVQKILFKKGYTWASGSIDIINIDREYIVLCKHDPYVDELFLHFNNFYQFKEIPLMTYNEFDNIYGLKAERRMKLKILQNED